MAAVKFVKITARVSGYIVDIPFSEGDIVHKGDLLFQIDPRPYQHAYEQAVGQLQQAKANQRLQEVTFSRQEKLRDTAVIAKEDYDIALSNRNQAEAQVGSSQAAVDSAALNLEFTRVTSPIDGRVSRQLVNIGNLVQADTTELTTVVSVDPIYAYFHVDELAELRYQRLVQEGNLPSLRQGGAPVYLQLQDEKDFPHEGTINFFD
ncbi:MAG TPA: efflux RND transporter periplasmic adaptor subunit, partial [Terriglobales bacterium]|nr:efflux RND transporter periplasmic adaptor subunit [Terriglobales bacterium]